MVVCFSYERFDIGAMALVYLMVKLREVGDVLGVGLQDIGGLEDFDAVLVDIGYLVLEEKRHDAFVLVVGTNSDQEEAEGFHMLRLERLEQIEPPEGQEVSATFAERIADVRHAQSDADDLVFLIDYKGNEIEIKQGEIHVFIVVLLLDGHGLEVI